MAQTSEAPEGREERFYPNLIGRLCIFYRPGVMNA
jgi:hypothetical protein